MTSKHASRDTQRTQPAQEQDFTHLPEWRTCTRLHQPAGSSGAGSRTRRTQSWCEPGGGNSVLTLHGLYCRCHRLQSDGSVSARVGHLSHTLKPCCLGSSPGSSQACYLSEPPFTGLHKSGWIFILSLFWGCHGRTSPSLGHSDGGEQQQSSRDRPLVIIIIITTTQLWGSSPSTPTEGHTSRPGGSAVWSGSVRAPRERLGKTKPLASTQLFAHIGIGGQWLEGGKGWTHKG